MKVMITSQANILAIATGPHLFWITSRAAGIAALILASISVSIGLLMGGRLLKRRGAEMRVTHEALSLATLAALAVHGLTLIGDAYLHPTLADIAIPFLSGYKTLWTSMGIIAFWALALLGLSYYLRAKIGVQRWRKLHRFTALAWVLGVAHSLGEGTDAGQAWFLAMTAIVVIPALALLIARMAQRSSKPAPLAPKQASRSSAFSQVQSS
jgi:sulfoxide reductase heme-binding subunit YedZ